jgi:hypothetical protein
MSRVELTPTDAQIFGLVVVTGRDRPPESNRNEPEVTPQG